MCSLLRGIGSELTSNRTEWTVDPMDNNYLDRISIERRQFVFDIANDEWVDRLDAETKQDNTKYTALSEQVRQQRLTFLTTPSTSSLDLHCFADHWNWGGGVESMRQAAEHPNCDAATALLLFWRSDPEYYLQFSSRQEVPDYQWDSFDLTQLIQERFLCGHYVARGEIGFAPRVDVRISEPIPGQRVIPEQLMKAILTR
jgi:hypothetical protein